MEIYLLYVDQLASHTDFHNGTQEILNYNLLSFVMDLYFWEDLQDVVLRHHLLDFQENPLNKSSLSINLVLEVYHIQLRYLFYFRQEISCKNLFDIRCSLSNQV